MGLTWTCSRHVLNSVKRILVVPLRLTPPCAYIPFKLIWRCLRFVALCRLPLVAAFMRFHLALLLQADGRVADHDFLELTGSTKPKLRQVHILGLRGCVCVLQATPPST